jgi:DNA-binding NarL/FixJ family response regulator
MADVGSGRLVLVTDADGRLPDPRPALAVHPDIPVIAVAARTAFGELGDLVADRAVSAVLVSDQPFLGLVASLVRLLRQPPAHQDPAAAGLAAALQAREDEARRFTRLTAREREVLVALLAGRSAAEIAAAEHVSMPTVRSHLRAVLTKLGVSSQLAAAAMAYRSCREPALVTRIQEIHQF